MPIEPSQFPRDDLATKVASGTAQVVLGFKSSSTNWDFERLPLHGDLPEAFRDRAEDTAVDLRDNRAGRAYDPEWDLKPDEFFYLANDPPLGGNFFARVANFGNLRDYKPRGRARKPNVWVVVVQLEDDTVAYFGARITRSAVLDRASFALRVIYRDEAFDSLDDTVISFASRLEWIVWQGVVIVLDADNFHRVFRDVPALAAMVDDHLEAITEHVVIEGLEALSARIKANPAMAVKLSRIIERADMHTRSPDVLRDYGEEFEIDVEWDGDKMIFDGAVERQWNILRLLDEARTLGPVTGKKWDTSSKVEIT
jgi:hypothetical protein